MKRTITLLLLFSLILILPGCGGRDIPDTSELPDSSTSAIVDPGPTPDDDSASSAPPAEPESPPLTVDDVNNLAAGTVLTQDELSQLEVTKLFFYSAISDEVFARMEGKSFGEGCVVSREELRYVRVLHTGFDGEAHIGELVVNQAIADEIVDIFYGLYQNSYPIEKMLLIDEYDGDDELSMEDNNTSCFNFRPVSGTSSLSRHAYGMAIDINPLYNPYVTASGYQPSNAVDYLDRSADIPYKIDEDDLCYQLFTKYGFTWGGSWNSVKDYQHFEME